MLGQRLGWAASVGRLPLTPLSAGATPKDSEIESLLRGWEVGWESWKDPGGLGGERRSHWRPALHLVRAPLGQGTRESLIPDDTVAFADVFSLGLYSRVWHSRKSPLSLQRAAGPGQPPQDLVPLIHFQRRETLTPGTRPSPPSPSWPKGPAAKPAGTPR